MTVGLSQIVDGGYCIGCGACCLSSPLLRMGIDDYGQQQVRSVPGTVLPDEVESQVAAICPFSGEGPDESELGVLQYGAHSAHDADIGHYAALFAGHASEGNFRSLGASGGLITWLLCELLTQNEIDGVVHVQSCEPDETGALFRYGVSRSSDEIIAGAKSRYYPVEASEVLELIRQVPGRYVFVGLPCFVKAVNRLARVDPVVRERVRFTVGLVCGHLKSRAFADSYGWQVGIAPGDLERIDFRVKQNSGSAGNYAVRLRGSDLDVTRPANEFFGSNWGHNFFRYSACDYCDDVFAETADLSVGDAWLPPYVGDPAGNGVLVVRDSYLLKLVRDAVTGGRLSLDELSPEAVRASQSGGIRDRREGLSYRLHLKRAKGEWYPRKRVEPTARGIPLSRRLIYSSRLRMRRQSHILWRKALERDSFSWFERHMRPLVYWNDYLYRQPAQQVLRALSVTPGRLARLIKGVP